MRIVIIGGGYAGLTTIVNLRRILPEAEIHLIDPAEHHLQITQLHRTLHRPLSEYRKPFAELAAKYEFIHHRNALHFDETELSRWQACKELSLFQRKLAFDFLVIATGAKPRVTTSDEEVCTLRDFRQQEGKAIVEKFIGRNGGNDCCISVVGAGATGLQFLFELRYWLKTQNKSYHLRLIDKGHKLFPKLPGFHDYIVNRLRAADIQYLANIKYNGQREGRIELTDIKSAESYALPSELTLLFPGVVPFPSQLQTNRYGQVVTDKTILPNIFAVGDCSHFVAGGLNSLTAQAALRKGKQVAVNIKRIQSRRLPYFYAYNELGYFISLGPRDGIGWLGSKYNVIKGLPAYLLKETIEAQYNLFIEGVDLYF